MVFAKTTLIKEHPMCHYHHLTLIEREKIMFFHFHIIMGIFAVPIGMMLGTSPYFFGLLPLAIGVGEQYGMSPENMSNAMLVGKNFAVLVTPHAATTFLCCGLAGVSIKELLRFCTPWLWGLSIISLFFAIVLGIVTV